MAGQQGPPAWSDAPSPRARHGRRDAHPATPPRYSWDSGPDSDDEPPPWAGPSLPPRPASRAGHPATPPAEPAPPPEPAPGRGRNGNRRARARRAQLKVYIWACAAVAVIVIAVATAVGLGVTSAANSRQPGGAVTTFQPGELRGVPDSCTSVAPATLDTYLPGKRTEIAPQSLNGNLSSSCGWTLDQPTIYRHLQVQLEAFSPSGLASGNGSATAAAGDAFTSARNQLVHPAKRTHLPPAAVDTLPGLGTAAFLATQVVTVEGAKTDIVTVVARDRNVLVTAVLQGLAHARGKHYTPVSSANLAAGAEAAARDALSHLS